MNNSNSHKIISLSIPMQTIRLQILKNVIKRGKTSKAAKTKAKEELLLWKCVKKKLIHNDFPFQ